MIIEEHGGADFSLKSVPNIIPIPIKKSAHGSIAGISSSERAKQPEKLALPYFKVE